MNEPSTLEYRRALEALRSGVPNRDAVRVLGCNQKNVEAKFQEHVVKLKGGGQVPGLLVKGGFGTGKSHLLEYLEHVALSKNCVCSRVVVSKETPLYDLAKMYRSAIENTAVPGVNGQAIQEIAQLLKPSSPKYADLYQWSNRPDSGLAAIFPATILLHERLNRDPELMEDITNFWAGDKLSVSRVKQGLKQIGSAGMFDVKTVPTRILAAQRLRFAARLIKAAGFAGWVVLIDEAELIGRYSPLQRGRSYSEFARWMGRVTDAAFDGVMAVVAITDDFDLAVLREKSDLDIIGRKLRSKATAEYDAMAAPAELGMSIIEREAIELTPPDDELLASLYARLKEIHARAYNWEPPETASPERTLKRPVRSYVRRWISEWDLKRLYAGESVDIEETEVRSDYTEDIDLETADQE